MSRPQDATVIGLVDLDLPTLVSLVGSAVDRGVLESLTAAGIHGLRPGHGHVVQRLVVGPSTVGEIAEVIGVTQQAVSKTVKDLVSLGYVEQALDPSDRRRHPLTLTPLGWAAVRTARQCRTSLHDEVAAAMPASDLVAARRVLNKFAHVLGLDEQVARRSVSPLPEQS